MRRTFDGGYAEYALARLGLRTGWVGGLNDSPMGRIVANHELPQQCLLVIRQQLDQLRVGGRDDALAGSPELVETFVTMKRFEIERHRAFVSEWELSEYLHHL